MMLSTRRKLPSLARSRGLGLAAATTKKSLGATAVRALSTTPNRLLLSAVQPPVNMQPHRTFASQPLGNVMGGQQQQQKSALEQFSVDLTAQAEQNKLDPIIGRHEEIRRCLQILARRSKNNPILIGEAGEYSVFSYCILAGNIF